MTTDPSPEQKAGKIVYDQEDIIRGLRGTLVAVLLTGLGHEGASPNFLRGALALARSQAVLYDIPWNDVVESLCYAPELCCLVEKLQDGVRQP